MHIISLALGGCLKGEPVRYGITEDTGGHIGYVLGEMSALAQSDAVSQAEIVTRLFDAPHLGREHAMASELLGPKLFITRVDSGNRAYLAKEALAADRADFTRALLAELRGRRRLPDLIHAHFADAADIARRIRDELGIPFIYTAHSLGIDKRQAMGTASIELERRIAEEGRAIGAADAIIASSRDECERQLPCYPGARIGRIHRLRPGIALTPASADAIASARALVRPFLRHPERPCILAIARPVAKKNLAGLVEAFARHADLRDRTNLVLIAGLRHSLAEGEEEQRQVLFDLIERIDRHALHGQVAYPPRHTQEEVRGLYALARDSGGVFVNPALTEPYGLTLIEAAAHGLPVVATRNGGPTDIIAELGHGRLVDPLDTDAIGAAIAGLVFDRGAWQQAAANARARIPAMSWTRYANGFVSLAREIVNRRHAPAAVMQRAAATRLLASDVDGTLTGCHAGVRAFTRWRERSPQLAFCAATGRSITEARRVMREWRLPNPDIWITSVGSEIYLPGDGDPGHGEPGQGELALDTDFAEHIEQGWERARVAAALGAIDGLVAQPDVEQRRWKLSFFASDAALADTVRHRLAAAGLAARVIFSHSRLLDVLPARAGKGAAVQHVARRLGIAPDMVFAAGDSGNDRDMLETCGGGIMVGNHADEIADLAGRAHIRLARRHHGLGVVEGLLRHGVAPVRRRAVGRLAA